MVGTKKENKKEYDEGDYQESGTSVLFDDENEEEVSITCPECSEIFAKTNNYHRHLKNIHMDIVIEYYKCTLAHRSPKERLMKYSRNFRKHLRVTHNITCEDTIEEMCNSAPRIPILHKAVVDHTPKRREHLKKKQNDTNRGECE